jgi:trimeric autotransporter adhesin
MKLKNACGALAILFCVSTVCAQVTGSGKDHTVPIWTGTTTLADSPIVSAGGNVAIGTDSLDAKLNVVTTSTTASAITGTASATTGTASGIFGSTASSDAVGVGGVSTATGGTGIYGSADGTGVSAYSTTTTGEGNGLYAQASSPAAVAIRGQNNATTGGTAIWGVASSSSGVAGLFLNTASGNVLIGQVGSTSSPSNVFRVDGTGKGYFDGGTQTGGADFAESVAVARDFTQREPGDLLIVDTTGKRQLKLSSEPYSTLVAGIYSTKPGVLATAHRMDEVASNEIPLAIVGIVPCKVSAENGPIQPGDLLVTSSTPGHAMKGTDRSRMLGAVVGKALEPLSEGKGTIQVLVTLQ